MASRLPFDDRDACQRAPSTEAVHAFRAAVLAVLGHAPESIEPGRLQRFATGDKHGDVAGWSKLFADLSFGVFGCHRSGIRRTWRLDCARPLSRIERLSLARNVADAAAERDRARHRQWADNARRIEQLWAECALLQPGDPVSQYLARRGLDCSTPIPGVLRLHPALPYWEGETQTGVFPAMVAPLLAPDGGLLALHRTYLTDDGRKAPVASAKKLTAAAGPLAGACIPLRPPHLGLIGIAEGIETALAAWDASAVPTCAAYSAGNLAAWIWPADTRRIIVFADNDPAGLSAAAALSRRATAAGLPCSVLAPSEAGADWCDVWAGRGAALKAVA